jgi:Fe-S-cluster-containing dehydrogenase component
LQRSNHLPKPAKPFDDDGVFNEKRWPSAKAYTVVNRYPNPTNKEHPLFRKIQCNHCLEPACATACPIKAYTKTEQGAVIYNEDLCFGCRYWVIACPFIYPGYDYESLSKRKSSSALLQHPYREKRTSACAAACPSGALTFGKRTD